MIAVVTLLMALPAGRFLPSRLAAATAYSIAYLWAFVFQTLYLLLDSLRGSAEPAFGTGEFPWSYGLVALAIFGVGFGLVEVGVRLRTRSRRVPVNAGAAA